MQSVIAACLLKCFYDRFLSFQMSMSPHNRVFQAVNSTIWEWSINKFTLGPNCLRYHLNTGGSEASESSTHKITCPVHYNGPIE